MFLKHSVSNKTFQKGDTKFDFVTFLIFSKKKNRKNDHK